MSTLSFNKTTVASIEGKSSKALDIFNKTVTDLSTLNAQIDSHHAEKQAQIEQLQAEQAQLTTMKDKHVKVINKITSFFSEE